MGLKNWLRRRRAADELVAETERLGLYDPEPEWTDPLNPHGDGTLRAGDPIFDAVMRGHSVHGNFGPHGWRFKEDPPG